MKPKHHFLISLICYGSVFYELLCYNDIIKHPYMIVLVYILLGIGGFHFGCGLGKIKNNY